MLSRILTRIQALVLFLFTAGMLVSTLNAQDTGSKKVTVRYKDVALGDILSDITKKSGTPFSYSREMIPADRKLSYSAIDRQVDRVIDDICRLAGIRAEMVDGYIVLSPDAQNGNTTTLVSRFFTVSGTVSDSATGELLIGAAVYDAETGLGAITNNYGFYSLRLPGKTYSLQVSFLGYSSDRANINLSASLSRHFRLNPVPVLMKEIVINSVNEASVVFNSLAAQTHIDPATVKRQPSALGETDMLKSLDNLPGISFQGEGSSFFSVRGGQTDQNLILLDEAPIFNPSHLLGLFTPVIPEAIKHTEVYKADFPVQFGGRLSSVIDIRARDGNMQRFSGNASLSPVSTRFSLEGPLKKDASSYFLSFRVSTFGWLVKAANPSVENFYFADFNSKFNIRLGKRDRLYLTLFSGKDLFINRSGDVRSGLEWSNSSATLRWSHVYGTRLFSNTTAYVSQYDYALYTNYDSRTAWNSDITHSCLKTEFTWYLTPGHSLKYGISIGGYFFNPGNYSVPGTSLDTMRVSQVNSGEFVAFAGDELKPFSWLKINAGIRLSAWNNYGEAYSIVYDNQHNPVSSQKYAKGVQYYSKVSAEPRLSVSLKTGKYASLKASYNRSTQHVNQISTSISPFSALEVWLPSGPNIRPQFADMVNLGFLFAWPEKSIEISADLYRKWMHNQIGYQVHAEMFLNPYLEGELRQGTGVAEGFEVMIRKTTGRLTGQLGYGYTRSTLTITGLNGGRPYPSRQDRPLDLSLALGYRLRPRWTINLGGMVMSGMPVTTPTGFYDYRGTRVPVYDKQNNDRLPAYKRVDLSSTWRLNRKEKTFAHYFTFTLYNFFNNHNYAFLYFTKTEGNDGKYYIPADKLNPRELVTTYRYVYSLVPSFTYSLNF